MPKRQLIAEEWRDITRLIMPRGSVSAVQRRETRKAFYAGAHTVVFRVVGVLPPDSEPTAEDLENLRELLRDLAEETQEFVEAVEHAEEVK